MAQEMKPEEKEIHESVRFYRNQGYTDDQIITLLKSKGFNEEVVEQILSKPKDEFKGTAIKSGGRGLDVKGMLLSFILLTIIAGAILAIWYVMFGGPSLDFYTQLLRGALANMGIRAF